MTATPWEYAKASDRLLGEEPDSFSDRIPELMAVPTGAVFLRHNQQRLEMWWQGEVSVVGYCDSEESDLDCAVTELSLEQSDPIASSDLLEWTCSCCGVLLGQFTRPMHIRRDAAFEIFRHIVTHNSRPDTSVDGAIIWTRVDAE